MKLASLLRPIDNLRIIVVALMLATIAVPASGSSVFAADYSVELGVDTRAGKDAGTIECVFNHICTMRLEPFGLRITVNVSSHERDLASVKMYGDEAGCCYFDGAAPSTVIILDGKLSRLRIFQGQRAKGAFFIQNDPVGILYLRFSRH